MNIDRVNVRWPIHKEGKSVISIVCGIVGKQNELTSRALKYRAIHWMILVYFSAYIRLLIDLLAWNFVMMLIKKLQVKFI